MKVITLIGIFIFISSATNALASYHYNCKVENTYHLENGKLSKTSPSTPYLLAINKETGEVSGHSLLEIQLKTHRIEVVDKGSDSNSFKLFANRSLGGGNINSAYIEIIAFEKKFSKGSGMASLLYYSNTMAYTGHCF
jgi:hypothetical protein